MLALSFLLSALCHTLIKPWPFNHQTTSLSHLNHRWWLSRPSSRVRLWPGPLIDSEQSPVLALLTEVEQERFGGPHLQCLYSSVLRLAPGPVVETRTPPQGHRHSQEVSPPFPGRRATGSHGKGIFLSSPDISCLLLLRTR